MKSSAVLARKSRVVTTLVIVGLAVPAGATTTIGPAGVITWGGAGVGGAAPGTSNWQSAVPASGTSTLAWNATVPNDPVIDSSGRVYFRSEVAATPQIGTLTTPRGVFTATNSADIANWQNLIDGNLTPTGGYRIGGRLLATTGNGIAFGGTLRVSGTQVGLGLRIGDPTNTSGTAGAGTLGLNETTSSSSTLNINNSAWYGGTYGTIGQVMKRNDAVTGLPASEYNVVGSTTGTARTGVDLSAITPVNIDMNASGVTAINGSFYSGTTSSIQDPIISNAANAGGATIGAGDKIIATKSASGAYNIIIHDASKPGYSHPYAFIGAAAGETIKDQTTAGGATFVKINRNGQVAHDAGFFVSGSVTAANDSALWIHTPVSSGGTGNVMVYREGEQFNATTGTLYTGGAILGPRSFSNAGVLYTAALANPTTPGTPGGSLGDGQPGDGDVGSANSSALFISTNTATTFIARQGDTAPGTLPASNVRLGAITQNSLSISNGGMLGFSSALQGSVTVPVTGNLGNNAALFGGPSNGLQMIARRGDAAPGFDGGVYNLATNTSATNNIVMNDNGVVLFSSPVVTGVAADGSYTSLVTMSSNVLFGWMPGGTAFPILYAGQSVEVDTGIFKTISTFSVSSVDNGDGGAMGLDDNNDFTARLTFSDNTWSVVKLQIPAPGTGGLALVAMGVVARRRRK